MVGGLCFLILLIILLIIHYTLFNNDKFIVCAIEDCSNP